MHARAAYAIAVLAVEALIALNLQDGFIRPYLGDTLAIALVYASLQAVTPLRPIHALLGALAIALSLEVAQDLQVLQAISLADIQVAHTLLGGVFDWVDPAAYAAGAGVVLPAMLVLDKPDSVGGSR
jgi:xanthosine utilization system XapX-like protein